MGLKTEGLISQGTYNQNKKLFRNELQPHMLIEMGFSFTSDWALKQHNKNKVNKKPSFTLSVVYDTSASGAEQTTETNIR